MNHTPSLILLCALVCAPAGIRAQRAQDGETSRALISWIELDASPGDMSRAVTAARDADAAWVADAQGNLVLRRGSGSPRRVIACGMDHPGYVVSGITNEGYLRLHRSGNARVHPLWDQSHQAQQVVIYTARGTVPGVVANPNGHFARQHRGDTAVVGVDDLWVDVGATSREEASALGIALMDPVYRDLPAWPYEGMIAGAAASGRIGCAAVASVARQAVTRGETIFVLSAQRSFRWSGLSAVLARLGSVDELVLVSAADPVIYSREAAVTGIDRERIERPSDFAAVKSDSVTILTTRARWAGTLVESVRVADAESLLAQVARVAGTEPREARWMALEPTPVGRAPGPNAAADTSRARRDSLAELLTTLVELPGVPGHEWRVRDAIQARLPEWTKGATTIDQAGNLIVQAGPPGDTTVFVAHLDEVAYEVEALLGDGRVTLVRRGGVLPSAWEGQPALLHFDRDAGGNVPVSLPGVFVPRDSASVRSPSAALTAWFGLDSAAMAERGVRAGSAVTAYKRGVRLGASRFTARALDDRAGSAALLRAVQHLDPARLDHTVLFVWSTAEESGLVGASALARRLGPTIKRVYAVDTFVSSDTPLERPTFAYAPLGAGPVLRALDDGTVTPRVERERVIEAARHARIPLQVGTTHGATDATAFVELGAVGAGLSWPGRYSHSPAEVLDLRDLEGLVALIGAVVGAR